MGSERAPKGTSSLVCNISFLKRKRSEAKRLLIFLKAERWVVGVYNYIILCICLCV